MKKTFILFLIALFASLVSMNPAFAEKRGKVDICHYDEYGGYWVLININGNAVNKHLANHDDGAPNGYTSKTSTFLDETCSTLVLPSCGNCLDSDHGVGCEESNCEAAIGAIDVFCLSIFWDNLCVTEAQDFCVDVLCTD